MNMLNSSLPSSYNNARKGAFDETINTTMYLRKTYANSSRLTRRQWARRRHLNGWLAHSNILKTWAQVYRFYRNHNKFIYGQNITKTSLLAFDLVRSKGSIPCLFKGSESVITASVTRKVLRYFSIYCNARLSALGSFKHTLLLSVSYLEPYLGTSFWSDNSFAVPYLSDHIGSLSLYDSSAQASQLATRSALRNLLDVVFREVRAIAVGLYKVTTLLTLVRIHNL